MQGFFSKVTTKSVAFDFISVLFHDEFSGRACLLPIDAEAVVNQRLLGIRSARLANFDDPPVLKQQARGHQAVGAQQPTQGLPVPHIAALREPMPHPTQELIGQDTDEDVALDPFFELVKIRPQQGHVKFP